MSDALGITPHRRIPMAGRDPDEEGRAASPLELLYDLTFVVAIGAVAEQMAELVVGGRAAAGVLGFVFGMWAIMLGWINFTWLASAFGTDDWTLLHERHRRGYVFGFGHIPVFMAIAGTGAGLHVAGLYLGDPETRIGPVGVALAVAVPVAVYLVVIDAVVAGILGRLPGSKVAILTGVVVLLAGAVLLAAESLAAALLVVMAAAFVPVVVHEAGGSRRTLSA